MPVLARLAEDQAKVLISLTPCLPADRVHISNQLGLKTMSMPFTDFDLSDFWKDSDYARREYVSPPFSDLDVKRVESELGYKLPTPVNMLNRIAIC